MAEQLTTISGLIQAAVRGHSRKRAVGIMQGAQRGWYSYAELGVIVQARREQLRLMGVRRGDRVCFIGGNSLNWVQTALACYGLGAVFVPMYQTQTKEDWAHIVNDCTPVALFAATPAIADAFRETGAGQSTLRHVVVDAALPTRGAAPSAEAEEPRPEDTACLIYTSGTSGKPKGVIQTHANLVSNVLAVADLGFAGDGDTSLAFLPWAHAFGHMADLLVMLHRGCAIAICENPNEALAQFKEVKPSVICVVPKVLERVYNQTRGKVAQSRIAPPLFAGALAAAKRKSETGSAGFLGAIVWWLASLLIFRKVRAMLGGNVRHAICGGAALPPQVATFMDAAEIPVYIGYGMTEASPVITVMRPGERRRNGTSGKPVSGVTVTLDTTGSDEPGVGEIVVRGPNVTQGYLNLPDETAKAITPDGALRTGDLGRFDEDGNLVVLGRNSERFKLSNGEWIAPVPLEEKILSSPLVTNVMVFGQDRPHLIAVVVPNAEALQAQGDEARKQLLTEVQKCIEGCKQHERVRGIVVAEEDFTQDNGLLTPTMKVRRRKVAERWNDAIGRAYN